MENHCRLTQNEKKDTDLLIKQNHQQVAILERRDIAFYAQLAVF